MLLSIDKFGGQIPQVLDPALLPPNKSQQAINVRFDHGGVAALENDLPVNNMSLVSNPLTLYYASKFGAMFSWNSIVDAVESPNPSDIWERIYYTEHGNFKVTDKNLYNQGGATTFPAASYNPCPPAPSSAIVASAAATLTTVLQLTISNSVTAEADGTYNLIFAGGGGTGAAGTYTVASLVITSTNLTAGGQYTANPTVSTQSGAGLILATGVGDQTLIETRGYVCTFVNGYGAEGPPSAVSNLVDCFNGDTVSLTGIPTTPGSSYNIKYVNIYRLNQSSTNAIFQFLVQLPIGVTTYSDSILDDALGETLATTEWDAAPIGLEGLISLPNGSLVGYVGNLLCFSVPYYPHAWPVAYQYTTDHPIMGLFSFGTTVGVLTSGTPVLAVGNDPSNIVLETMDMGWSCMSKQGVVQAGDVGIYPSPEGLIALGAQIRENVTETIMTRQDWQNRYNPSSINGFYWEGKYVGFYQSSTGVSAGFLLDLKTKDLMDLPFYATAAYRAEGSGILFLALSNGNLVQFANIQGQYRTALYTSKKFEYAKNAFTAIKVLATKYPVQVNVVYPNIPYTVTIIAGDRNPIRLKGILTDALQVSIWPLEEVSGVFIASSMEEIPL